jgi:hypothetical protein
MAKKVPRASAVWDVARDGTIANGVTQYIEVSDASLGNLGSLHIRWTDATTVATVTAEQTNDWTASATAAGVAGLWLPEPDINAAIVNPTGAGAGGCIVHVGNNGAGRMRLKIVTAAVCSFVIWPQAVV